MAYINIRIDDNAKEEIQKLVDSGEYADITEFVREAIREKLDPEFTKSRMKKELFRLIRTDPDIRKELGL